MYLRQEGNANSDVEAVLNIDPELHTGVRMCTVCIEAGSCSCSMSRPGSRAPDESPGVRAICEVARL